MEHRMTLEMIPKQIKTRGNLLLHPDEARPVRPQPQPPRAATTGRCYLCGRARNKTTRKSCSKCYKWVCVDHLQTPEWIISRDWPKLVTIRLPPLYFSIPAYGFPWLASYLPYRRSTHSTHIPFHYKFLLKWRTRLCTVLLPNDLLGRNRAGVSRISKFLSQLQLKQPRVSGYFRLTTQLRSTRICESILEEYEDVAMKLFRSGVDNIDIRLCSDSAHFCNQSLDDEYNFEEEKDEL
ncbi:hypothetical protein J6590_079588 [Homalodisca vitripennis]|nr:hypothetical protein J6590_079588 [Homalodisca vitripennis]